MLSQTGGWLYRHTESRLWTVGYYSPNGDWVTESVHASEQVAGVRVNFLNGGLNREAITEAVEEALRAYHQIQPGLGPGMVAGDAEPPDGTFLYWPGSDGDDVPLAIVRDDDLAEAWGNRDAHWFAPNEPDPLFWVETCEWMKEEIGPVDSALEKAIWLDTTSRRAARLEVANG